jgi:branched-chain amino acid aminotransferase
MKEIYFFIVEDGGIRPLPISPHATSFDDLYDGLELGVYSALRTFSHNKFLWLDAHIKRMVQSMVLLGWEYTLDQTALRQALHDACSAYPLPEARVRFDVLAAPPVQFDTTSRVLIALMPFTGIPDSYYERGVRVGFADTLVRDNPLAKTADFAVARQAYTLGTADSYERLLLDQKGHILECTGANFLGFRDSTLITAKSGVLEGITLKIILHLAGQLGLPVSFLPLHVSEIGTLDEAALCSSSRAIIPIVQIGEAVVASGRPGPLVHRLLTAYRAYVDAMVETAV